MMLMPLFCRLIVYFLVIFFVGAFLSGILDEFDNSDLIGYSVVYLILLIITIISFSEENPDAFCSKIIFCKSNADTFKSYICLLVIAFFAGANMLNTTLKKLESEKNIRKIMIAKSLPVVQEISYKIRKYIKKNGYQSTEKFLSYCNQAHSFSHARKLLYLNPDIAYIRNLEVESKLYGETKENLMTDKFVTFPEYAKFYYESIVVSYYKNAFCQKAAELHDFYSEDPLKTMPEFRDFFYGKDKLAIDATTEATYRMRAKGWVEYNENSRLYSVIVPKELIFSSLLKLDVDKPGKLKLPSGGISNLNNKIICVIWCIISAVISLIAVSIAYSYTFSESVVPEYSESAATTTESYSEQETDVPKQSTQSAVQYEESVTVTEESMPSNPDYSQLAYDVLTQRAAELSSLETQYCFADITRDEIPELIIAYGEMNPTDYQEIYLYSNGEYQFIATTTGEEFYFVPEKKLIISCDKKYGEGCLTEYAFYQISGNSLTELDIYRYYDNSSNTGEVYFQHYDTMISESECVNAVNQYMEGAMYPIYEKY